MTDKRKRPVRYPHASEVARQYNEAQKRSSRRIDYALSKMHCVSYHVLSLLLCLGSVLYAIFVCQLSYQRLLQSLWDACTSFVYYILLFAPEVEYTPSFPNMPDIPFATVLPFEWETFKSAIQMLPQIMFDGEVFISFMVESGEMLSNILRFLILAIPIGYTVVSLSNGSLSSANAKWFERTKPLKAYENFHKRIIHPIKQYFSTYRIWMTGHYYSLILFLIWFCNLNFTTIIVELLSFYFYFIRSFDFVKLYVLFYKVVLDIMIWIKTSWMPFVLASAYLVFDKIRKSRGYERLYHFEGKNNQYLKSLPIMFMLDGDMGCGKTQQLVNLSLSRTLLNRNNALEDMYLFFKWFPDFPWLKFEKYISLWTKQRIVYNWATIEKHMERERYYFESAPSSRFIFGYDIDTHPLVYDDGVKEHYIWDVLEDYAKLYFMYCITSSLLVANFSVREDFVIENAGNAISLNTDFFRTPSVSPGYEDSKFAHILNYDILRVGRKMIEDEKIADSFEFGVVVITEIGKERGNTLANLTVKKTADECNQKNDLLNHAIKMIRHRGTVNGKCYVSIGCDEQRAMSLEADLREVLERISIEKRSEPKLALPFFYVESLLHQLFDTALFTKWKSERMLKGNRGLFSYLLNHVLLFIINHVERVYNLFGYEEYTVLSMRIYGTESTVRREKIYLSYKKVRSDRYATDSHAQFFRVKAVDCGVAFEDYPTYSDIHASFEELHLQHSFFIRDMETISSVVPSEEHSNGGGG